MSGGRLAAAAARQPTPEQGAAIAMRRREVLLEAGAGSGKTGVMVDRYCRLVCDEGAAVESILAFTFTEKAATELRQRIRARLGERAEAGSEAAAAALAGIGGAWVMTIHGFCSRVLTAHPVAAGIDPAFRVLDAAEAARVAREAFDEAILEFLAEDGDAREETVAAFGLDGLRGAVVAVHEELRSRGEARPRLPDPPEVDAQGALERVAEAARACLVELKEGDSKRELPERALALLGRPGEPPDLDDLVRLTTRTRARALLGLREAIDEAVAAVAGAGEGAAAYRHLAELLRLFSARYEAAKERRAGVDFEDLQILAARLLEREEIGASYRDRFGHLLVDEFQDTNRLQLRLIEALRGPRAELVAVGDELQSIYGFRHADLEVFRRRREEVERSEDAELMRLSGNFRSRPEVVAAINLLGEALLGTGYRPLTVGEADPPSDAGGGGSAAGARVELLLTGRQGWDSEEIDLDPPADAASSPACVAEARFLARRLRELADAGAPPSQMVVLLRAFTHLDAFEEALERAGLRPYVVGGRGYWSQQQVADACALLAVIANPLDDHALFGALASPACGAAPDTLWLLRAAAGRGRHVWPALERAAGGGEAELAAPERLADLPAEEVELLSEFAGRIRDLRERARRLPLAGLIEAAVTETGYDLAILMRPAGEARFANLRKLTRLAAEFEASEGRDLRGFLDFLAARAEGGAEAQAATAAEGHDGVRIMTVHNAKGLEFGVVAVPQLSRQLLNGGRSPLLAIGREEQPRVGLRLRRLGSPAVSLYDHAALCEEQGRREAEEELRLFHVAATRARERLILSGIVNPEPAKEPKPGAPVVERLVEALGIGCDADTTVPVPPPVPRPGLEASFGPAEIAVRVNLPSPERAAELRRVRGGAAVERPLGSGPPPLAERRPPVVPSRPLSYTAIGAYEECPYRFYLERVLGLPRLEPPRSPAAAAAASPADAAEPRGARSEREERSAHGAAVHALLEWSHDHGWSLPPEELAGRQAAAAGLEAAARAGRSPEPAAGLLGPVEAWLGSPLLEAIAAQARRTRAELPLLLGIGDTVLRGSIDLLVEREGAPPLVVDYKTDRLAGGAPAERAAHYGVQRSIYALAVAEALEAAEVEVAYVFLERPEAPAVERLGPAELSAARERLRGTIARIGAGEFPAAPAADRDWPLCQGCPALAGLCAGPRNVEPGGEVVQP